MRATWSDTWEEVHPDVLDNYKIGEKGIRGSLDMPAVTPHTSFDRKLHRHCQVSGSEP